MPLGEHAWYLNLTSKEGLILVRTFFLVESLIPMTIIIVANGMILYKCNQVMSRLNQSSIRRWRTTLTCLIISLGYLCCWLPVFIFKSLSLSRLSGFASNGVYLAQVFSLMGQLNSTLNPVLYSISRLRKQTKRLAERIPLGKKFKEQLENYVCK